MQKHERLVVSFAICCLLAIAFVPVNAQNIVASDGVATETVESRLLPGAITIDVAFPYPVVTEISGRHVVAMGDLPTFGGIGEPVLPFRTLNILIPQGKEPQDIAVTYSSCKPLKGEFFLDYGQPAIPISRSYDFFPEAQPLPDVYGSATAFPPALYSEVSEQYVRGHRMLLLNLHPMQYIPRTGQLSYFDTMTVTISLRDTNKASPLLRNLGDDQNLVRGLVDNPEAIQTYAASPSQLSTLSRPASVDPSKDYNYVIVTDATLNSSFQPLVDWKTSRGLNATTVLIEDILDDPDYFSDGLFGDGTGTLSFNDTAARLRNFVKDIYLNWGTEYVLLGGDTAIIPYRGVYGIVNPGSDTQEVDYNIPCDMYFGALDGSWDNDNDTVWGEGYFTAGPENATAGDEADFYAEVYIGRATVTTPEHVENFVNKTLWYEQNTDDAYFKKAVMVGETLDAETKSGNVKDLCADEIPQYSHRRLYNRDNTYSRSKVISTINSGLHILNHAGHCNTETMMDLTRTDVDALITNTEYFLGYSTGCYAAAFDADCVVEHYIYNPNGAFAFISNSRYGWYYRGMMNGAGDRFDYEFFKVLNDTVTNLAKTLQTSKENLAGSSQTATGMRWTYFELNLLGDPETPIQTEIVAPTAQFDTNPEMRLEPPTLKGFVNLTGIAKKGTAPGATFSNYTVEFGFGNDPVGWMSTGITLANGGQSEVVHDLLATWDTNLVSPGRYTLRITAKDLSSRVGEDRWIVNVAELPAIRVLPQITNVQAGLNVTVSVKLTDPENLWGVGVKLSWNTTLLSYLSHQRYIPIETYPWGVLRSPVTYPKNELNTTAGTYWLIAKSTAFDPFERDGTIFNMTFQALTPGTCNLTLSNSNLTDYFDGEITHKTVDGVVEITEGVHDIAVADVTSSTVVGQNYDCRIVVTLENEGTFGETFNFTVFANGTPVNITFTYVAPFQTQEIVILWDTTGWPKANYTISVEVPAILGEADLLDNQLTSGVEVCVTTAGDVDADGDVDIYDIVMMSGAYGTSEGDPSYLPNCDIDGDGDIDIYDIVIAAGNYGQ